MSKGIAFTSENNQWNQTQYIQVAQSVLFRRRGENITQGKKKIRKLLSEAALEHISPLNDPSFPSNSHFYFTLKLISWDTNLFQINTIFSLSLFFFLVNLCIKSQPVSKPPTPPLRHTLPPHTRHNEYTICYTVTVCTPPLLQ